MDTKMPSPLELRILGVLWRLGSPATVQELCDAWRPPSETPGYTTVLKKLPVLEEKGFVAHKRDGRAYRDRARSRMKDIERSKIRELQEGIYEGNRLSLVMGFLSSAKVTDEELAEARRL